MRTALWEIQKSIYTRLSTDTGLAARVSSVLDSVEDGATFPFVALGEDTLIDWGTKTGRGEEVTHTLHIWSNYRGDKEVMEIMDLVIQAITREPLVAVGFDIRSTKIDFAEVLREKDLRHGIIRLLIRVAQ